jgi:hypothetical protein
MERILWLYSLPYNPLYPVICFDERPCFLIGNKVEALAMKSGQVTKEHYAYEKNGSACLLAAIEPLTGERIVHVKPQRTMLEYTQLLKTIAAAYPQAIKIRLVQDNLSTHSLSAFYQHLPADEAFALAQRFEFYFTPTSASWLNMIEIEFSALARLCLNRRIPTIEKLEKQILAIVKDRNDKKIKIDWQFSIESARTKLNSHYQKAFADNSKFALA